MILIRVIECCPVMQVVVFCMHDLIWPLDSPPLDRQHSERAECARSLYPAGTVPFSMQEISAYFKIHTTQVEYFISFFFFFFIRALILILKGSFDFFPKYTDTDRTRKTLDFTTEGKILDLDFRIERTFQHWTLVLY